MPFLDTLTTGYVLKLPQDLYLHYRKKDADGSIIEIILDGNYARTYSPGQIYFEPQTGELFKNVSKTGDAPRFVKVIFD